MALMTLGVAFIEADTGREIVTIKAPATCDQYENTELTVKELYRIEKAGMRYIKERIGYSGAVRVKVVK